MRKAITSLLFLAFLFAFSANAYGQVPKVINYQARLLDDTKNPIEGDVSLTFRIYDSQTGGTVLWSEQIGTTAYSGYVNEYLGLLTEFTIDFSQELWLEVEITDNSPYERVRLTAVPYAFRAIIADSAGRADHAIEAEIAATVYDGAITQDKLAEGVQAIPWGAAGGILNGEYPNPGVDVVNLLQAIPAGSITQEMLREDVRAIPRGEARGDLAGYYPDPVIKDDVIQTDYLKDSIVTSQKIAANAINTEQLIDDAVTLAKLAPGEVTGQVMYWNGEEWVMTANEAPQGQNDVLKYSMDEENISWQRDGLALPYQYNDIPVNPSTLLSIANADPDSRSDVMYLQKRYGKGTVLTAEAAEGTAIKAANSSSTFATITATNEDGTAIIARSNPVAGGYVIDVAPESMMNETKTMLVSGNISHSSYTYSEAVLVVNNINPDPRGLAIWANGDIYTNGRLIGDIYGVSSTFTEGVYVGDPHTVTLTSDGMIYGQNLDIVNNFTISGDITSAGSATFTSGDIYVGGNVAIESRLTVNDMAMFNSDLYVGGDYYSEDGMIYTNTGDLYVGGMTMLSNVLYAFPGTEGMAFVDIEGDLGVYGDQYIEGNLDVDYDYSSDYGNLTLNSGSISVDGNAEFANFVYMTNYGEGAQVDIEGGLNVEYGITNNGGYYSDYGDIILTNGNLELTNGNLTVGGATVLNDSLIIHSYAVVDDDLTAKKDLYVEGNAYFGELMEVNVGDGYVDLYGDMYTYGDTYVQNDLDVDGDTWLSGRVDIDGVLYAYDRLYVDGVVMFNDTLFQYNPIILDDNLYVGGTSEFVGDMLSDEGDFTLGSGELTVDMGNTELLHGDLNIYEGDILFRDGDLDMTNGDITLAAGNLSITNGDVFIGGVTTMNDSLILKGAMIIDDNLEIKKNLKVNGRSDFVDSVMIQGYTMVDDDVDINGYLNVVADYRSINGSIMLDNGSLYVGGDAAFLGESIFFSNKMYEGPKITAYANMYLDGNYESDYGNITLSSGSITVGGEAQFAGFVDIYNSDGNYMFVDGNVQVSENFYVGGYSEFVGDMYSDEGDFTLGSGELTVDMGNAELLHGDLIVNEGDVLFRDGDLEMTNGDLSVTTGDLYVGGITTLNDSLLLKGAMIVDDDLEVKKDLYVAGKTTLVDSVAIQGYTLVDDNMGINGDVVVSGSYTSENGSIMLNNGYLYVGGDAAFLNESIMFTNKMYEGPKITAYANMYLDGNYESSYGNISLNSGSITVGGQASFAGFVDIYNMDGNYMFVDGNMQLYENLYVGGTSEFVGDMYSDEGDFTLGSGELTVDMGNTELLHGDLNIYEGDIMLRDGDLDMTNGDLNVANGDVYVGGVTTLNDSLLLKGALIVDDDLEVKKDLYVAGKTTLVDSVAIQGYTLVDDNMGINGDVVVGGSYTSENGNMMLNNGYLYVGGDAAFLNESIMFTNKMYEGPKITAYSDMYLDGNYESFGGNITLINGNITVGGQASFADFVEITNDDGNYMRVDGNANIYQNLYIGGTSEFVGDMYSDDGDLTLGSGDLTVDMGNTELLHGDLNIYEGDILFRDGDLDMTNGDLMLGDGDLEITNGDLTLTFGDLLVGGVTTLNDSLILKGSMIIDDDLEIKKSLKVNDKADFLDSVAIQGYTLVDDNMDINGDVVVGGSYTSENGNMMLNNGYLYVGGDAAFLNEAVTITNMEGSASLNVYGQIDLDGALYAEGIIVGRSSMNILDDASFGNDIYVDGNYYSEYGNLSLSSGSITVGGRASFADVMDIYNAEGGYVDITGTLSVDGEVDLNAGTIDGTTIGYDVPAEAYFTELTAQTFDLRTAEMDTLLVEYAEIDEGHINNTDIGVMGKGVGMFTWAQADEATLVKADVTSLKATSSTLTNVEITGTLTKSGATFITSSGTPAVVDIAGSYDDGFTIQNDAVDSDKIDLTDSYNWAGSHVFSETTEFSSITLASGSTVNEIYNGSLVPNSSTSLPTSSTVYSHINSLYSTMTDHHIPYWDEGQKTLKDSPMQVNGLDVQFESKIYVGTSLTVNHGAVINADIEFGKDTQGGAMNEVIAIELEDDTWMPLWDFSSNLYGTIMLSISPVNIDGPAAFYILAKSSDSEGGICNRLTSAANSDNVEIEIRWQANTRPEIRLSGATATNTYKIIATYPMPSSVD